jgi:hypothetical protein
MSRFVDAIRGVRARAGRSPAVSKVVVVCLALAILGELSRFFGSLAVMGGLLALAAGMFAVVRGLISLFRGAFTHALRMLIAALGACAALFETLSVVFDTPCWVKHHVQPFIERVMRSAGDGPYPRSNFRDGAGGGDDTLPLDVEAALESAHCFYSNASDPPRFRVTCMGVGFSKHTYDSRRRDWYTWD